MESKITHYNRALAVATKAHAGQTRKNGEPYINHCIRVADAVPEHLKVASLLHDVIEDTDICVCDLQNWFGDSIAFLVRTLTHDERDSYLDYILEVKKSEDATTIKLADLADNLNGSTGTLKDKYELARWILEDGR